MAGNSDLQGNLGALLQWMISTNRVSVPDPPAVSEGAAAAAASAAAAGTDAAATASALSTRFLKEWEAAGCPGHPFPTSTAAGQKGKRTFDHAMFTHSLSTRHADGAAAAAAGAAAAGRGNGAAAAGGGAIRGSPMIESKGTFAKKLRKASPADRSPGNDLESCEAPECTDFARFALPASPSPTRCSRHAAGGMIAKAKPRKACDVCTARKTRCDSVRPTCGTCAAQFATCRYSARLKSGPKVSMLGQANQEQEHRAAESSAAGAGGEQQQLEGSAAIGDVAAEAAAGNGAEGQPLIPPSMLLAAFSQDQAAVAASEVVEAGAAAAPAPLPMEAGPAGTGATVTTAGAAGGGGQVPVEQLPLRSPSQGLNLLLLSQELQEAAGTPRPSAGGAVSSTKSTTERSGSSENGRGREAGSKPAGPKPLRTSCDRCTMRKIKCDGREGKCQRCDRDNQFCHYSLKSKSGPKPNSVRRKSSPTPPRERSRPSPLSLANLPPGRIRGAPGRAAPPLTSRPSPAARSLAAATGSMRLAGADLRANGITGARSGNLGNARAMELLPPPPLPHETAPLATAAAAAAAGTPTAAPVVSAGATTVPPEAASVVAAAAAAAAAAAPTAAAQAATPTVPTASGGQPVAAAAEGTGAADGAGKGPAVSGTVVVGGAAEPRVPVGAVTDASEAGGRGSAGAGVGGGVGRGMFSSAAGMNAGGGGGGSGGGAMAGPASAKGHNEAVEASRKTGMVF
ncbi:unnamed protein product [Ectocarpus sp. 12 AP-2014]